MHPPIFITHPKRHLQPFLIELPSMQHSACSVRSGDPWRFTSTSRNRGTSKELTTMFLRIATLCERSGVAGFWGGVFPTIGSNACRDQADQPDQCGLQSFGPQEFMVATIVSFVASHDGFSMKAVHTLQCVLELIASVVETSEADGVLHASSIHDNS